MPFPTLAFSAALGTAHQQPLLGVAAVAVRRFRAATVVSMGHGSHSSDNNPEILDREKQRSLTGQTPEIIPGEPGWNPALASDSEAAVRAERAPSQSIEEMQEQTVKVVQHLHHDGEHPGNPGVPDEVHNPSAESPAIRDNLKKTQEKEDVHNPL